MSQQLDMALLNRFEKHEFNSLNMLDKHQKSLLESLNEWIQSTFKEFPNEYFVFDYEESHELILASIVQNILDILSLKGVRYPLDH